MNEQAEIAWFTPPVSDRVGYGYAAVSLIKAFQRAGVKVSYDRDYPLVHVSFVQPDFYHGESRQYRIGYTPWESSQIPEHWVPRMREMDEIWTTSTYCVDVFRQYEVNDIIGFVPHGIDTELWTISERFLGGKFTFLHVGGPTERKGGQKVVDAFLQLFDGNDDFRLVLKSNGPSEARWIDADGRYHGNAGLHPQIKVISERVTTEDLVRIYHAVNCLVYPTNGEGFGLIPFQGIATGLPTICTNATGCADFAEMSIPLDWAPSKGEGIHLGDWVEPSYEDLVTKMQYVVDNYQEVSKKTMQSARIIHENQSWDAVAQDLIKHFGDKIYKTV